MILIFTSFETMEHAEETANILIDEKLAACVSLIPVRSFYFWKGKKMTPDEVEGIIKTTEDKFDQIEKRIKELLEYETPQLIAVKEEKTNKDYLKWVEKQVNV